jgi:alcohol dehydrogenase
MRAAVLEEYGEPLVVEAVEPPSPPAHGVVVAVEACGVCRSDWHAWQGHGEWADDAVPRGQVLGHEPAGRVVEVGERVERLAEGERVAVPFNLGEGACRYCTNGRGNVCPSGLALGFEPDAPGAFAEYVAVPHADFNAAELPESVDFVEAAALGCRFATAYHALAHRADVGGGDRVAVLGCGGLGLSVVQIAGALGAAAVAVDLRESALERARDLGAVAAVDASEGASAERIREAAGGDLGVQVAVDALGSAETCRAGVEALEPAGTHVQVGLTGAAERGEVSLPTDLMARRELAFLGARGMPPSRYDELLRLVGDGTLDPGALVTRELDLAEVSERLEAMTDYRTEGIEVVTEF